MEELCEARGFCKSIILLFRYANWGWLHKPFFFPVIEFSGVFPLPTPPMINKKEKKKYPNVSLAQGKPIPCVSSSNAHPLKKAKPCRKEGGLSCVFFSFCVWLSGFFPSIFLHFIFKSFFHFVIMLCPQLYTSPSPLLCTHAFSTHKFPVETSIWFQFPVQVFHTKWVCLPAKS